MVREGFTEEVPQWGQGQPSRLEGDPCLLPGEVEGGTPREDISLEDFCWKGEQRKRVAPGVGSEVKKGLF